MDENNKLRGDLGGAIVFHDEEQSIVPKPIIRIMGQKSAEEKIYLILFYRTDEDENLFHMGVGREDAYMAIERMCNTYPIDILKSQVLVEVPAVDKFGKGVWMMKNPEDAVSVYAFCKNVEKYFTSRTDFDIEEFNSENREADNDRTPEAKPAITNFPGMASQADAAVAEAYMREMQGGQNGQQQ